MTRSSIAVGLFLAGLVVSSGSLAAGSGEASAERLRLQEQMVQKWGGYVAKNYNIGRQEWVTVMQPAFAEASMEEMSAAATAKDFDSMSRMLLGSQPLKSDADGTLALGDPAADLVYVPVTPCRIFDTRFGGGQIAANTVRNIDVTAVSNYSFQGGAANDCGGVGAAGSFAAAVINLTVVNPSAPGFITAFPFAGTQPDAATVNFAAGAVVGNTAIVKLDQGASANEMSVYSFATTHLVGDIVGYFITPQVTAPECTVVQTSYSVAAGGVLNAGSPACAAGYAATGGGCFSSAFAGRVVSTYPNGASHFCSWANEGGTAMNAVAMQNCCRIPGR